MIKRKIFSDEFKKAAVERVFNGETQVAVAQSLGISSKTLHAWCQNAKQTMDKQERSKLDEVASLRQQLRQAQAEIEFLKNKMTSRPSPSIMKAGLGALIRLRRAF